jgi:hypothetical protein
MLLQALFDVEVVVFMVFRIRPEIQLEVASNLIEKSDNVNILVSPDHV